MLESSMIFKASGTFGIASLCVRGAVNGSPIKVARKLYFFYASLSLASINFAEYFGKYFPPKLSPVR
jgi:hypothetical protein